MTGRSQVIRYVLGGDRGCRLACALASARYRRESRRPWRAALEAALAD